MSKDEKSTGNVRLFGTVKELVSCALFVAMSIILGKFLSIKIGDNFRISFENLSLIMAGMLYGPLIGMATAAVADVVGCILYGYSINPVITLGAASIGLMAGIASLLIFKRKMLPNIIASVYSAHILGSMIIKSIGLAMWYNTPVKLLLLRVPIYIVTGFCEIIIIYALFRSKGFRVQFDRIKNKYDQI
ncbi:MAG: folate family ECF transporter S component [Ruminococcus sp.]|nr:folate family ECF transporter S component [Ruminococcus sp.]